MLGEIISAGANLLGGFLSRSDAKEQAEAAFNRNAALQREFAQNGIRWKVEDAKAAGIHPAYAIGAPAISASPISVGDVPSMGASLAAAGNDIGRAISATRTQDERLEAYTDATRKLTLDRMALENQVLASQLKRFQVQRNPPMPSADKDPDPAGPAPEEKATRAGGAGNWPTDPALSDMQKIEDRYGDGVDPWGYYIMWRDYQQARRRDHEDHSNRPHYEQAQRWRTVPRSSLGRHLGGDWFSPRRFREGR